MTVARAFDDSVPDERPGTASGGRPRVDDEMVAMLWAIGELADGAVAGPGGSMEST